METTTYHIEPSLPEAILPMSVESRLAGIIEEACLGREANRFFVSARYVERCRAEDVLSIAEGWRELTKAFMLTTISGIGVVAREAAKVASPPRGRLAVLQTGFEVIGDDLGNVMDVFASVAPAGVDGIHYQWWQDSVEARLREATGIRVCSDERPIGPHGRELVGMMHELATDPLGAAVQLRVVEAIALDITVAFKRILMRTTHRGVPVMEGVADYAWMDAHIHAEVAHNQAVSNHEDGMGAIHEAEDAPRLCQLAARYARLWNAALGEFADAVSHPLNG